MTETGTQRSSKWIVVSIVTVAVLVAGYFATAGLIGGVESELTSGDANRVVDALAEADDSMLEAEDVQRRALDTLKDAPIDVVFDKLRDKSLTDEQRDKLESNLRELMFASMQRNVNEYMNATPDQRDAIMDRHLDEWDEFREKMRAYREKHKDDPEYQKLREERRERRRPSKEERRDWMENRSPDQQARMWHYMMKMRKRAQERGEDWGRPRGDDDSED